MPQKKQIETDTKPKGKVAAKKNMPKSETAKSVAPAPAPVPVPAPAPVVETKKEEMVVDVEDTTTMSASDTTIKEFSEFQARLSNIRTSLSNLLQDFKTLQKKTERELKNAQKVGSKRKRKTGARQPSGFVKPTLISNELADFLGKDHGSELARTEVTREINAYIRANKLQDPANGRKINPDNKLKKLLAIKPDDELTYFNLQRYMSPHFQKLGQPALNATA
tara:strand:- start:2782 stop:3447 length:666 start_codon:yes stop_codon:yes gene_type:complete